MDLQRKVELMRKYDFPNFGNRAGAVLTWQCLCASANSSRELGEECIKKLYGNLEQMQKYYAIINFGQLKSEMAGTDKFDFATLFLVRKALPKLKSVTDEFVAFFRGNNYFVSQDNELYLTWVDAARSVVRADNYKGVRFRDRRLKVERLLEHEQAVK